MILIDVGLIGVNNYILTRLLQFERSIELNSEFPYAEMTGFAFEIYTLLPIGVFETHEIFEPITQGGSRDQAPNTRIKFWQVCVVAFAKLHVLLNLPQRHLKWRGGGRGGGVRMY